MNKRNLLAIIVSLNCIFLIISSSFVDSANLTLIDTTQDIIHMNDGVTQASGLNVQPEIDIVTLEINETTISVTFVATPILDIDNFYDLIIYWNGDEIQNFTDGHWNQGNIISQTKLVNSTGDIIVNAKANDSILLIGNTLYFPILNASYITNKDNPGTGIMDCRHRISVDGLEFYRDVLDFGTRVVPGYTFLLSLIGIITLATFIIIKKKKR